MDNEHGNKVTLTERAINKVVKSADWIWHCVLSVFVGSKTRQIPQITDDILLQSATSLAEKIRTKKLKSEEVVSAFITRISTVNPILNAVVDQRFEDALEEARRVDIFVEKGDKSVIDIARDTPFLGVPFSIKNSIAVRGLVQDVGVLRLKGRKSDEDSEVVQLMRNAGAIPLVISNTPEYCSWMDSCNPVYGRTLNPYDLTKIPGGSSGGEAALIGSGASVFGIGTDGAGSIRIPCYACGIFGHKPTKRAVSNLGLFARGERGAIDDIYVTGPMCRYADDLLPMFKILVGQNVGKLKLDDEVDIKKLKVYYMDEFSEERFIPAVSSDSMDAVKQVTQCLNDICEVPATCVKFKIAQEHHATLFFTKIDSATEVDSVKIVTGKTLSEFRPAFEFLKWLMGASKHTFYMLVAFASKGKPTTEDLLETNRLLKILDDDFQEMLGTDGVLILPTQPQPHYYHHQTIFKTLGCSYTGVFNTLGYPVTQCSLGMNKDGMPMGVQVIALTNNDHLPLAVAMELQKRFGGWTSP